MYTLDSNNPLCFKILLSLRRIWQRESKKTGTPETKQSIKRIKMRRARENNPYMRNRHNWFMSVDHFQWVSIRRALIRIREAFKFCRSSQNSFLWAYTVFLTLILSVICMCSKPKQLPCIWTGQKRCQNGGAFTFPWSSSCSFPCIRGRLMKKSILNVSFLLLVLLGRIMDHIYCHGDNQNYPVYSPPDSGNVYPEGSPDEGSCGCDEEDFPPGKMNFPPRKCCILSTIIDTGNTREIKLLREFLEFAACFRCWICLP